MSEIKYEIIKKIGVLSTSASGGLQKELNLINWNDCDSIYEIHECPAYGQKNGQRATLTKKEVIFYTATRNSPHKITVALAGRHKIYDPNYLRQVNIKFKFNKAIN